MLLTTTTKILVVAIAVLLIAAAATSSAAPIQLDSQPQYVSIVAIEDRVRDLVRGAKIVMEILAPTPNSLALLQALSPVHPAVHIAEALESTR